MDKQAYLILQNGMAFAGARFGAEGEIAGEVVFTTGMTGYFRSVDGPQLSRADFGADLSA